MSTETETKTGLRLHDPQDIIKFAATLKSFIKTQNLSVTIKGNEYVLVDGWKFAGMNFGLTAIPQQPVKESSGTVCLFYQMNGNYEQVRAISSVPEEIERLKSETVKKGNEMVPKFHKFQVIPNHKYQCSCDVIRTLTSEKVSAGFALCSNEESLKAGFDEYAVMSMAQTRAIAKAFRNLLGFVMKAAGFQDTPAEEMEEKYVTTDVDDMLFDEAIKAKIAAFTDAKALTTWVKVDCEYLWPNKDFQKAIQTKKAQLTK